MDAQKARRIIECLRSGVSSLETANVLTVGREQLVTAINEHFRAVRQNSKSENLIVEGAYGQGKTHILNKIESMALQENFAVSRVVAGRESPLGRIDNFYQRLVRSLVLPDRPNDHGVKVFLDKIGVHRQGGPYDAWMLWVRDQGYTRLYNLLESYYEARTDDPEPFYEEIEGTPVPISDLKRSLKIAQGTPRLRLSDYWGYLRAISQAIHLFGYAGWVILIDEAELIQGLSLSQRIKAYETLARLWGLMPNQSLPGSYTVVSFARSFYSFMQDRDESGRIRQSLLGKGLQDYWSIIGEVLERLETEKHELNPLSWDDYSRLLDEVLGIYRQAYGFTTTVDRERLLQLAVGETRPVRTLVRTAIQYLDLRMQYPDEDPLALLQVGLADEGEIGEEVAAGLEEKM